MAKIMAVDIETYSSVDLVASGVRPYSEADDFEILLIAYKVDDEPTQVIDLAGGDKLPGVTKFTALLLDPDVLKTAYNAAFERTCLARWFQSPMPPEQWSCTMVLASNLGLPGTLAGAGAALGLDKQKMTVPAIFRVMHRKSGSCSRNTISAMLMSRWTFGSGFPAFSFRRPNGWHGSMTSISMTWEFAWIRYSCTKRRNSVTSTIPA